MGQDFTINLGRMVIIQMRGVCRPRVPSQFKPEPGGFGLSKPKLARPRDNQSGRLAEIFVRMASNSSKAASSMEVVSVFKSRSGWLGGSNEPSLPVK